MELVLPWDSLVSLLPSTRENAHNRKSLDLRSIQCRRGHHPLEPIMSGLVFRCSSILRLWSSSGSPHLFGPAHPSRLSLAPAFPLLSAFPFLSLSRSPSCLFLCLSYVSRCSGFTIGFPVPQSRARPGHDCSIFSTRLALPSPAPSAATSIPRSQGSEVPIKVPLPGAVVLFPPSLLPLCFASFREWLSW